MIDSSFFRDIIIFKQLVNSISNIISTILLIFLSKMKDSLNFQPLDNLLN